MLFIQMLATIKSIEMNGFFTTMTLLILLGSGKPNLKENEGTVVAEKVISIISVSKYGGKNEEGKHVIKYSCLGATKRYIQLSIIDSIGDTTCLFIEMNNYYQKYLPLQLLNKKITYKAQPASSLTDHHCGFEIPENDNYLWLNGEMDNIKTI